MPVSLYGEEPMLARGPKRGTKEELAIHIQKIADRLKSGPVFAFFKFDGIRGLKTDQGLLSRTFKPIPNRFIAKGLSVLPTGRDGEIITYHEDGTMKEYNDVQSDVMSEFGEPRYVFWQFDYWNRPEVYEDRLKYLTLDSSDSDTVRVAPSRMCFTMDEVLAFESEAIDLGYEGIVLRGPKNPYKWGRSTIREFGMVKLKRFEDSEAIILAIHPEMENRNEAKQDNFGRLKRSHHQANMVARDRMGHMDCRDIYHGWEFSVGGGPGVTHALRAQIWAAREQHIGKTIIKYKYFPYGMKDVPRHPGFLGFRDKRDI